MVTAMSVADDDTVAVKHEIDATLRAIIGDAVGDSSVDATSTTSCACSDRCGSPSSRTGATGSPTREAMADNLAKAAELLLP